MAAELGERVRLGARGDRAATSRPAACRVDARAAARSCAPRRSSARCPSARCATSPSPASPTRGSPACTASARRCAAKVVAAYPEPVWRAAGANGLGDWRGHRRLDLAAGRRRALDARRPGAARRTSSPRRRPSAGPRCSRRSPALRRGGAREPDALLRAPLGRRPVHPGLHRPVGARRPHARSARCTGRTSRRSTSAAPTTGWPATWRARCAPAAPRRPPRWARRPPRPPEEGRNREARRAAGS